MPRGTSRSATGAASAFAVTDAMTYTARITPAADGAVTVDVAANVATDVAGNGNSAATRVSSTYTMPRLSISVNNGTIAENGGTATVTLRTPAPFQTNQTITLAVSGTATENTDYGIGSKSLTLTAGDTSITTVITASDDTADEDDETVIVTASAGGNAIGSVTVTITDDDDPADIAVSFDSASYTATEGGTAATVTVTLGRAPDAAATIPLTVMEVGGADSGDYSLAPANKMLVFSTSQTSRTLTVTAVADADDDDGESLTIGFGSLPTGFAVGTTASTTVNITDVDITAPRVVSIERRSPASTPTNANSLTWRVTFSEDVANVDQADFAVSGATATLSVSEVTASTVYDVTASGGTLADLTGTVTLTFASNHNITDTASNALANTEPTGANNNTYVVDNTKPAVTITGVPSTSTAPFTATFTFLEAVTGFAEGDITVGNGAASAFAVTDAMTYTARITPAADGAVTVDVAANVATDVAGNGNSAATRVSSTYTMPRLSISVNNGTIAENGGTATVTLRTPAPFQTNQTITLAVSGTATENTDYGIGSKSLTLTAGDTSITTVITASDDTADEDDETVIVTASAGGNAIGSVTVTITDDDDPADIAVSFDSASYTATEGGTAATVTVTLGRAPDAAATIPLTVMEVGGADSGDYSLAPANKMLVFSTSQTSRTLTVTAVADADDDDGESLTIGFGSLPTGFAVGTTASTTVNITDVDITAPRVVSIERRSPASTPTNANSLTWRVTFSEDVANVDQADFAVSGATATLSVSEVTASTVYDVTASGGTLADLTGTVTLTFASNHNITDTASNALANTEPTGANNNTYVVDNTKPAVTITGVPSTSTAPFTATFTFLEAVTGFAEGDITVGNGAASAFAVTDAMTYTARITPAADGAVTVDVAANVATDVAGNGNSAATRVSSTYTMPRLSISVNNGTIAENGGTATVTLRTPAPFQTNQTITLAVSGTATENTDYGIGSKSLTLTAGDTSITTVITASDDTADEDDETVIVTASAGGNAIGSVTVTITDDDDPADIAVSFDADTYTAIEGGTAATVTVTLSRAPSAAATIPLTVMEVGGGGQRRLLARAGEQDARLQHVADEQDPDGDRRRRCGRRRRREPDHRFWQPAHRLRRRHDRQHDGEHHGRRHHRAASGFDRAPEPRVDADQREQPDLAGDVQRGRGERGPGGLRGERRDGDAVRQRGDGLDRVRRDGVRGHPGRSDRHGDAHVRQQPQHHRHGQQRPGEHRADGGEQQHLCRGQHKAGGDDHRRSAHQHCTFHGDVHLPGGGDGVCRGGHHGRQRRGLGVRGDGRDDLHGADHAGGRWRGHGGRGGERGHRCGRQRQLGGHTGLVHVHHAQAVDLGEQRDHRRERRHGDGDPPHPGALPDQPDHNPGRERHGHREHRLRHRLEIADADRGRHLDHDRHHGQRRHGRRRRRDGDRDRQRRRQRDRLGDRDHYRRRRSGGHRSVLRLGFLHRHRGRDRGDGDGDPGPRAGRRRDHPADRDGGGGGRTAAITRSRRRTRCSSSARRRRAGP